MKPGFRPEPIVMTGRCVSPGRGEGEALIARTRISFWGGFDPVDGRIIEVGNPLQGQHVRGKVMVFTSTKGSSATSNALNMAGRCGQLPAAFINTEIDSVNALGCLIQGFPLVTDLDQDPFAVITSGDYVQVVGQVQNGPATVAVYKRELGERSI